MMGRFPSPFLPGIALVSDPADPVASPDPAQWAAPRARVELGSPVVEQPANTTRVITRSFESDVEDKPWLDDCSTLPRNGTLPEAHRGGRRLLAGDEGDSHA